MTTPEGSRRCAASRFGLRPTRLAAQRVIEDLHHLAGHQLPQSPVLVQPRKAALYDPALGHDLECVQLTPLSDLHRHVPAQDI